MKKLTLSVTGMSCEHCEKRVTKALLELEGMKKTSASAKKSEVVCQFDESKLQDAIIKAAIVEAGYEVQG